MRRRCASGARGWRRSASGRDFASVPGYTSICTGTLEGSNFAQKSTRHSDSVRPIRALRDEAPALHDRAMDNLRYIRETMEGASAFTAVPGWGGVAMGITAMITAVLASRQSTQDRWLAIWIGEALISICIAAWAVIRKSRRAASPI